MRDTPIRILIAEDDYLVKREIKHTLRSGLYEIVGEANNGAEAVRMVEELNPDVILMDIKMPQLDGIEASRQIQDRWPTPIVILTAHESKDLLELASNAGVGAYLVKPPNLNQIEQAITIAIARHHDLMELRKLYNDLKDANSKIKTLEGILPICMFCKNIRDDEGYWQQVERYVTERSGALFSHGICQKCMDEHYPELSENSGKL